MANTTRSKWPDEDPEALFQIVIKLNQKRLKILNKPAKSSSNANRTRVVVSSRSVNRVGGGRQILLLRSKDATTDICNDMNAAIESYSRAWNAEFASEMLRKLPRELRDVVYQELVLSKRATSDDTNDSGFVTASFRKPKTLGPELGLPTSYMGRKLRASDLHYFHNEIYMGTEFVKELAEVAYRYQIFQLDHQDDLREFLATDMFETGCDPTVLVTAVEITVSLVRFHRLTGKEYGWSSPKYRYPLKMHYEKLIKALAPLKTLFPKPRGLIRLLPENSYLNDWISYAESGDVRRKFCEVLAPLIYDLKDQGWMVECSEPEFSGRWAELNFDSPRTMWEQKLAEDSIFASDDPAAGAKY